MIGTLFGHDPRWTDEKLAILDELSDIKRNLAANDISLDYATCELRGLLRRPEDEASAA
jgi:hypothetical protein